MQGLRHLSGNNHRTKNSCVWKKLLIQEKCYGYCFLYSVWKIHVLVLSMKVLDSKGILNTLKKGITSAMECADLAALTFATWQMRSLTLLVYFSRSYCHKFICNFAIISCWFGQLKRILWLFFSKGVKRFEEKLNICWSKQERPRTCSVCVNATGKPNRYKISRG